MDDQDEVVLYGIGFSIAQAVSPRTGAMNKCIRVMYPEHKVHDNDDHGDEDIGHIDQICASDSHIVLLTGQGNVYSAGSNTYGQCGIRDRGRFIDAPVLINFPCTVGAVACGLHHTAFVLTNGLLYTCGDGDYGRLGVGGDFKSPPRLETPAVVYFGSGNDKTAKKPVDNALSASHVLNVSCGALHTAAIVIFNGNIENRYLYTMGAGNSGRLGHGDDGDQYLPKCVAPPYMFEEASLSSRDSSLSENDHIKSLPIEFWSMRMVACGSKHTICVTMKGAGYSFGFGGDGRLGLGNEINQFRPKRIGSCTTHVRQTADDDAINARSIVTYAACGLRHSGIVTAEGSLFTFGRNSYGQLGHNQDLSPSRQKNYSSNLGPFDIVLNPQRVQSVLERVHVVKVYCGFNHTIALGSRGKTFGFGNNSHGQSSHADVGIHHLTPVLNGMSPTPQTCTVACACTENCTYVVVREKIRAKDMKVTVAKSKMIEAKDHSITMKSLNPLNYRRVAPADLSGHGIEYFKSKLVQAHKSNF